MGKFRVELTKWSKRYAKFELSNHKHDYAKLIATQI